MCIVGGARFVLERGHVAFVIERAAQAEDKRGTLGVPASFFVTHPLHAHGPLDLISDVSSLEAGVVRRAAAVQLRTVLPLDAYAVARHAKEVGHATSHAVGLHVVRPDGHLTVRWIGHGVRRTQCGVTLEWIVILRFNY